MSGPVTLVGGGIVTPAAFAAARAIAPRVIAADGGAHGARALGVMPERIVGDLDSLGDPAPWIAAGVAIDHLAEQETTDFAKCLYTVAAPLYLAVGFTGHRLDHTLAVLSEMAARPDQPVILVGEEEATFLAPLAFDLTLAAGARVSLWPVVPTRVTACDGLVWRAAGLMLDPLGRIGTSNAATGGAVRLAFDRRGVFVILPLDTLAQVAGLLSPPVSTPAG